MIENAGLINVLIASPLEPRLVDRIAAVDPRLRVIYRGDLLGQPRYAGDHFPPIQRSTQQTQEWSRLLAEAEVMLDVDQPSAATLLNSARNLRWIQSSSSGIGEWIRRLGLVESPVIVTNSAGMHATPLAEFAVFAMLYFAKRWPRMVEEQHAHHWERCTIDTLEGKTLGVVGLGNVGQSVVRLAKPFGLHIIGVSRGGAAIPGVDRVFTTEGLPDLLRSSDFLVLSVPSTPETVGMLGAPQLAMLKPSAVLINIARGTILDEPALIAALTEGRLGGAALDVVSKEPLAADSQLWDLPNVLITPHSMSTAYSENDWLTDLFCDNLRRYLAGVPLRNQVDKVRGY